VVGEVVCPKCGKPGRLAVHRVRTKGRVYAYTVVKHVESGKVRRCILERAERSPAPADLGYSYEDAMEIIHALYASAKERALQGDASELAKFLNEINKMALKIAQMVEEARALLQGYGELAA
jgi:hypothetical protein